MSRWICIVDEDDNITEYFDSYDECVEYAYKYFGDTLHVDGNFGYYGKQIVCTIMRVADMGQRARDDVGNDTRWDDFCELYAQEIRGKHKFERVATDFGRFTYSVDGRDVTGIVLNWWTYDNQRKRQICRQV